MADELTIDGVYPWGRSFDEYRHMFSLSDSDLDKKILGCADGPAAFNAEMHRRGKCAISFDPLYRFNANAIRGRVEATAVEMVHKLNENTHRFVWDRIKSPDHMAELRLASMEIFLTDYEIGKIEGRYVDCSLPNLKFSDGQFELAVCSHFLFLYADELSLKFHVAAIKEICRVAGEARIFPILQMNGKESAHLRPATQELCDAGLKVTIEKVDYEFQRGGNQMMRVKS